MAKKEKKWSSLKKAEKTEWLRGEIDKVRKVIPRTAAHTTKRLADIDKALSDKIKRLSAKVDRLSKELQDAKKKLETLEAPAPAQQIAP